MPSLANLGDDLRFAARLLRRNPGFTAVAALTLALGIGANTAMWSVLDAVLLRPLPYPESERIAVLGERKACCDFAPTSPANFLDYRRQNRGFEALAAYFPRSFVLTRAAGPPAQLAGQVVTPDYFAVFGVPALLGRTLSPAADPPGGAPAAVLGYGAWHRVFAADPAVVGSHVTLGGRSYAVVGVMPPDFAPPGPGDLWVTPRLAVPELADDSPATLVLARGTNYLRPIGRLRRGVSVARAQEDVAGILRRILREAPDEPKTARLQPLRDWVVGDVGRTLWTLAAAVGLVLLIACANLASLLLARATVREREMALRASLGASPGRLLSQLAVESALLGALGGALGLGLALGALRLVSALEAQWLPRAREIHAEARVFLFALAATLLAVALAGLLPAIRGARAGLHSALQEGGRAGAAAGGQRLRRVLVAAEIAMSLALLAGAGLLLRSFSRLLAISPGFEPRGAIAAGIQLPGARYPRPASIVAFYDRLLARAAALPGVAAAGLGDTLPFGGSNINGDIQIEGRPKPRPGEAGITAEKRVASGGYFRALKIPLLRGRLFDDRDRGPERVVLVNESLARFAWPGEDPIGKRIDVLGDGWQTVVGVVGNLHASALDDQPTLDTYLPYTQVPVPRLELVVRSAGDPLRLAPQIRAEVLAIDRDQPVAHVDLLADLVARSFAGRRFHMLLVGSFALLALLLAGLGIYGVMAYAVAQRTREIGVRIALGAGARAVCLLLLRGALALTAAGIAAGTALALGLGRGLQALLYGTESHDPAVLLAAAALLAAVALSASLVPTLRALRIDPVRALRAE